MPLRLAEVIYVLVRGTVPSSTTDFGEGEHDAPHLALVPQTIFTDDLEFRVPIMGTC